MKKDELVRARMSARHRRMLEEIADARQMTLSGAIRALIEEEQLRVAAKLGQRVTKQEVIETTNRMLWEARRLAATVADAQRKLEAYARS